MMWSTRQKRSRRRRGGSLLTNVLTREPSLIKKKRKFSSYMLWGNADEIGRKVKYVEGLLIYGEISKDLVIYEAVVSHLGLCNRSCLNFLVYEENFIYSFISVPRTARRSVQCNMLHDAWRWCCPQSIYVLCGAVQGPVAHLWAQSNELAIDGPLS